MSDSTAAVVPPSAVASQVAHSAVSRLVAQVVADGDGAEVVVTAPYDGDHLVSLPVSTVTDVERAAFTARVAQREWSRQSVAHRAQVMLRFHDLVLARQREALDLMQAETGKARRDAFLEVIDTAMNARYYARSAPNLLAAKRRRGAMPVLTKTLEHRVPKGLVVVISPSNYPLSMAATDAIPALMAGNAVLQKPDTQTALTALWVRDLMVEAGLPADLWQMVVGFPDELGEPLIANADFVMFTGSTSAGRRIARDAGSKLIGASLELGGKNAMLVLPDAPLSRTVGGAVAGCFSSTGQLCVAAERMYVHEDIYDEFVPAFTERVRGLVLAGGFDYEVEVGSLRTQGQFDLVRQHVDDAVENGAIVLAGGRARPDIGPLFYEPTVLTAVTTDMRVSREETFGPVVSVYRFDDLDAVIDEVNGNEFGLNASVWTADASLGRAVAERINAGTVNINDAYTASWGSTDAPMGGMGASGLGRRHGADGLLKYTEQKTVAHQRFHPFGPPRGLPFGVWATALTVALRIWRRSGLR